MSHEILENLAHIRFGVHAKGMTEGRMLLVQSAAVEAGGINQSYLRRTDPATLEPRPDDLLRPGDVLLVGKGSTNPAACWPGGPTEAVAASMLFVIRPTKGLLPEYLAAFLNSREAAAWLAPYRKDGTVPVLGRKALGQLPVPLPDADQQRRLVQLHQAARRMQQLTEQMAHAHHRLVDAAWAQLKHP